MRHLIHRALMDPITTTIALLAMVLAFLLFTLPAQADTVIPDACYKPVMSKDGQTILYWNVPDQNCAGIVRVGNLEAESKIPLKDRWNN